MKKLYIFLVAILVAGAIGLSSQAQTDVTSNYLSNADFDVTPICYTVAGGTALNTEVSRIGTTGWIFTIPGWENGSVINGNAVQIATGEYGTVANSQGFNGAAVPSVDKLGASTGACVSMSAGWGDDANLYQNVTLPAGRYALKLDAYNAFTVATATVNFTGFIPNSGTAVYSSKLNFPVSEWTSDSVSFYLVEETAGKINIGITTSNGSSSAGCKLFIDHVKLIYYGIDKSDLQALVDSANYMINHPEEVGSSTVYTDLQTAVDNAQAVIDNTSATAAQVVEQEAYMKTAIANVHTEVTLYGRESSWTPVPYDVTSVISNPTIEGSDNSVVPDGWTINKGTGNSYTNTSQHYSGDTSNRYLDSWASSGMLYTAQQTIIDLPNGTYKLTSAARTSGSGSYVYAKTSGKTYCTEIINNSSTGGELGNGFNTITVEAAVLDHTLTIGVTTDASVSGGSTWTGSWFSADDFTLSYLGEEKVLTVSKTSFLFDDNNASKVFNVSGSFLTDGVTLFAPEGITLSRTSLTAAEAQDGVDVTAQFTGSSSIENGTISIVSGSLSKTITFDALYGDAACFTPTYADKTNLIVDTYCNDRSKFGGWGNVAISKVTAFCGERSLKTWGGGSLDASISGGTDIESNKTYRAIAKIYVPSTNTAKFGLFALGISSSDVIIYNSTSTDTWETADFTFKTGTVGTGGVFFQRASGSDSVFIDNYELYEVTEPTVRIKYVDADDVNTSIKDDRIYSSAWSTTVADYLMIGGTYTALETDKETISYGGFSYLYDNTSTDNVTIDEGENVITLKFQMDPSTKLADVETGLVSVYPTIAKGVVNVDLKGDAGMVRIFDATGKLCTSKFVSNSVAQFPLSNSGLYFVEIRAEKSTKTVKVTNVK
ncbi:MAG: T9SS type A sorting domain-containing protein [Paludibacter sp.]|nr:T9SS type A sorting domain-containing protein [Paludibacter sp.]